MRHPVLYPIFPKVDVCICDEEECNKECECEYGWCTHSTTTTTTTTTTKTTTKPAPSGGIKCYQCQGGGAAIQFSLQGNLSALFKPPADINANVPFHFVAHVLKRNLCFGVNRWFEST